MKAICSGICLLCLATSVSATELYVSPGGNDADPGTAERPLATLTGARNAIRALKTRSPLSEPVHVKIAGGIYTLDEPLLLEPQDSGTPQAPITYQALPGARPEFRGGRVISGWQQGPDGIWQTHVADVAAGRWYFEQLFVQGAAQLGHEPPTSSTSTCRTSNKRPSRLARTAVPSGHARLSACDPRIFSSRSADCRRAN